MEWLQNGSRGEAVAELQRKLTANGFNTGSADGVFGPNTEAAVRRYQEQHGLQVDGIAGPETFASLGLIKEAGDTSEATDVAANRQEREAAAQARAKAAMAEAEERREARADTEAAATAAESVEALRKAETAAEAEDKRDATEQVESGFGAVKDALETASASPEAPKGFKAKIAAMREARRARKGR